MARAVTSRIQPAQIQKKTPSFFLVTSAAASAANSSLMSAKASLVGSVRLTLLTGDPRVDDREQEVEDEVDQDDGDGHDECDALHDRVVVLVHAGDELVAESGHLQQELDHERAGDERTDRH